MLVDDRVRKVLEETFSLSCARDKWEQVQSLKSLLPMDSMAVLEFLAGLEKEFGFRFPPQDLELDLFTDRHRLIRYIRQITGEG